MISYSLFLSLSDLCHLEKYKSIFIVANGKCSFLFMAQRYSIACVCLCVYRIFSILPPADGHLVCFHIMAIVNSAIMNIGVHISFQISVFVCLEYVLRSGTAGSYGSSVFRTLRVHLIFNGWLHSILHVAVVQSLSHVWLCDSMDYSTPGSPVLCHVLELAQTPVHWVSDAMVASHPLSSPSPPAFNISQHQGLF